MVFGLDDFRCNVEGHIQRIIQRCFFYFGDLSVLRAVFKFNVIVTNDGSDEQIWNIFYINLHVVIH